MEKYKEKKLKNQVLARFIRKFLSESSWEIVQDCNTFMMMVADETLENKKQHKGNTCKNRFCPICSWKKAKKEALALAIQMEYIKDTYNKDFIFLTLTTPNVKAEELHEEIKEYNHAFQKLVKRKEVQNIVKGYIRKLEVTYNQDRDDYNPHFHVLIAVNKSYFNDRKQYIAQARWLELWQQVTKNPLITNVHVQKVRTNSKKEVAELAKYSAKDSDYLANEKVFDAFYKGLKGKQLMVYSGLFKESNKLFKEGELDHYKEQDSTEYVYALLYHWGKGNYVEDEKRFLTNEEREKVNGHFLEDINEEDFSLKEYEKEKDFSKSKKPIDINELNLISPNSLNLPTGLSPNLTLNTNKWIDFASKKVGPNPNTIMKPFNNLEQNYYVSNDFWKSINKTSFSHKIRQINTHEFHKSFSSLVNKYSSEDVTRVFKKAMNNSANNYLFNTKNLNIDLSKVNKAFEDIKINNEKYIDLYKDLDISKFNLALERLEFGDNDLVVNEYLDDFVRQRMDSDENVEDFLEDHFEDENDDNREINANLNEKSRFELMLMNRIVMPCLIMFQFHGIDLINDPIVSFFIAQLTVSFTEYWGEEKDK